MRDLRPNPLPLILKYGDENTQFLHITLPYSHIQADFLSPKTHAKYFDMALTEWGQLKDPKARKALWDCYFPDTKPHIYHLLFYRHQVPMSTLVDESGLSERAIRAILRRPKLKKRVLRAISAYACRYRDALASKRTGRDPEYTALHLALTDRSRID